MTSYEQKKHQLLDLICRIKELALQNQQPSYAGQLEEIVQRLEAGTFMTVICGEFRRGKSSLINAFLNETTDLFPVEISVTTSMVTTISYGPTEKIVVHLDDEQQPGGKQITISRAEIRQYVTEKGNRGNQRQVRLLEMFSPNEQLKRGLILVDTPGIGSMYQKHTEATSAFLPLADAVLFVSDALTPLSSIDLNFIKEQIMPYTRDMLFVLTKKDLAKDYRVIMQENRQKLAKTLACPEEGITIVPVSSLAKADALESEDPADLAESNFPELEKALWRFIEARRGRIHLAKALAPLSRILAELRLPLQTEHEALQQQNEQKKAEIERELNLVNEYLQRLQDQHATWQQELHQGIEAMHEEARRRLDRGYTDIRAHVEQVLNNENALAQRDQVLDEIQSQVNALLQTLERALSAAASQLQGSLEARTGLDANPFDNRALVAYAEASRRGLDISTFHLSRPAESSLTEVTGVARDTLFISNLSHLILPATIFAGAMGYVLLLPLGVLGWLLNTHEKKLRALEQERRQFKEFLKQQLYEGQREHSADLTRSLREIERMLQQNILNRIKQEQQSRVQALKALQEARKLNATEAQARLQPLKATLGRIDQLQVEIEALASSIASSAHLESEQEKDERSGPAGNSGAPGSPEAAENAGSGDGEQDHGSWADGEDGSFADE